MPGYSKGAQGLSVYVRVTGIFTGTTDSPSALRRQCPNRYAIRAGRNLPDKEFRLNLLLRVYRGAGHFCRPLHVAMQSGLSLRSDLGRSDRLASSL
jgi:hypothetical protein